MNEHMLHDEHAPALRPRPAGARPKLGGGASAVKWIALVVLLALGLIWWRGQRLSGFSQDWQAVFLTNGQVYFGKIAKINRVEAVLEDIYYLQVTRPLQQTQEGQEQANPQGELSLVKLGNELHGPTDAMHINRDQILFIEDLKDDSNVTQAINNYKTGQQSEAKK